MVNILCGGLLLDRLPHRLNLSSRGLDIDSILCLVCSEHVESNSHAFFSCSAASNIWRLEVLWDALRCKKVRTMDGHTKFVIIFPAAPPRISIMKLPDKFSQMKKKLYGGCTFGDHGAEWPFEEKDQAENRQINYQSRCSFLELYALWLLSSFMLDRKCVNEVIYVKEQIWGDSIDITSDREPFVAGNEY
ncbi:RNA-directed DNA polymerase, eukaryota [Tanacetum coccineum]